MDAPIGDTGEATLRNVDVVVRRDAPVAETDALLRVTLVVLPILGTPNRGQEAPA